MLVELVRLTRINNDTITILLNEYDHFNQYFITSNDISFMNYKGILFLKSRHWLCYHNQYLLFQCYILVSWFFSLLWRALSEIGVHHSSQHAVFCTLTIPISTNLLSIQTDPLERLHFLLLCDVFKKCYNLRATFSHYVP